MNATQSKQILTVATRALALLNPEWQITAELRQMLESANSVQAPAVKARSGKIRKDAAYYTYKPIIGAPSHKLLPRKIEAFGEFSLKRESESCDLPWKSMPYQADPTCQCAGCQILNGFWKRNLNGKAVATHKASVNGKLVEATAISTTVLDREMDRLSLCACGGNADDHAKDELENLLKCSHCDTCEAFHYDVDASEQQAA